MKNRIYLDFLMLATLTCLFASEPIPGKGLALQEKPKGAPLPTMFSLLSQEPDKAELKRDICQTNLEQAGCTHTLTQVESIDGAGIRGETAYRLTVRATCPDTIDVETRCRSLGERPHAKLYKLNMKMLIGRSSSQGSLEQSIRSQAPSFVKIFAELGCTGVQVSPETIAAPDEAKSLSFLGFAQVSGDCPAQVAVFPREFYKKSRLR